MNQESRIKKYLSWDEKTISDFSEKAVTNLYSHGYVFTRLGKGVMHQTRSVRIDLSKFELSSENRRLLRKGESIAIEKHSIPYAGYSWEIAKMAKDFYDLKAGGAFSANKIKELISNGENFNALLEFKENAATLGYAICYQNGSILHYSYPFYDVKNASKDMGLIMMTKAIIGAKLHGHSYVYLGSLQRPSDTYKLQFEGLEWFDGVTWQNSAETVKEILAPDSTLPKHVHIIGICGVATSALAIAFHKKGVKVTGSDKGIFAPVSTELKKHGVSFYAGWHPEKIAGGGMPDIIIMGGIGTSPSNPEVMYAKEHGIPLLSFAEAIGRYIVKKNSIVTTGTWGKTTSSALLSFIMIQAGIDPSYFTGGISLSHDTGALSDSDWSVVEGDEYQVSISDKRPKFVFYSPTHLLLTSVSWDHADLYPTEASYFKMFEELIKKASKNGKFVACIDDAGVNKILSETNAQATTYGMNSKADYKLHSVGHTKNGITFSIDHKGKTYQLESLMLGRFNAENIAGCFAMAMEIGIPAEKIIEVVKDFKGIKRRFEKRFVGDVTVLDCHAPTPEKAAAVLESIREVYDKKIFAVFEPNIGGRNRDSAGKYDGAFKGADTIVIPHLTKLKVTENETNGPMEGDELLKVISATHADAHYFESDEKVVTFVTGQAKKGDVIVFLGSHGFRGMIEGVIAALSFT